MELSNYGSYLEKLTQIPFRMADNFPELERFCEEMRFHKIQDHLYPDILIKILENIEENQIVSLNDDLQIHLLFGRVQKQAFVFGPYCCESLSTLDARTLLNRCGISKNRARDLLVYRSRFTVISEADAIRVIRTLISHLSGSNFLPPLRTIDLQNPPTSDAEAPIDRPYAETVSERYVVELDMMRAIEYGNTNQALRDWRQLHLRMDYLKKQLGYSLETSRESASITRTVIRVGGMNAGLPPVIVDQLTGEISRRNRLAKSIDEIENNTETLIREMCREVRRKRLEKASYLVQSVKYHIETHFAEDLTVSMIAEHLDIPESRLIELFRLETGATPGNYLRTVRMRKAADLLTGTRWSVQKIASEVGIPDANYFVKLFKREYGETPTNYRKTYSL